MSCEIKRFATIADLDEIRNSFGFSEDENWLNSINYSLSPTGEIIVVAHGSKFVFLCSRWDNESQQNRYAITWKGELDSAGDIITSVICLPIIGPGHSIQNSADWTCIAFGLASGFVHFYTDFGLEIFRQQWHNESVQLIRAQSGRKVNEEVHIMYLSCFCILQGVHLFHVLKSMKQNLQKNKSSQIDLFLAQEGIPCRKWSFGGKNLIINDAVVVGAQRTCTFDHLLTASLEGGFYAKYKNAPPQNSLVLGVGAKPYVGFHWAREGFVQPVLADVARAVASKIKSALPTWLTGTSSSSSSQTQSIDQSLPPPIPSESMTLRYGLCDIQRTGLSIWLAPGNKFAAVADSLGRVILIDCIRCIAIRVWKGYRDAQCGFIKSTERQPKQQQQQHQQQRLHGSSNAQMDRRHALFLVIFAPRRSCLEIWSLQRGPKVAAFSASKHGQLIYNSYSLMGSASSSSSSGSGGSSSASSSSKIKYPSNTCVFLDPIDQSIKEISVPFHCALNDSNSKPAKDLHLMRRIKMCLRSSDNCEEDILNEIETSCRSFQTDEIRLQCLEMLIKNTKLKPIVLQMVLKIFSEQVQNTESMESDEAGDQFDQTSDAADPEEITNVLHHNQLILRLANYTKLVDFYIYATDANGDVKDAATDDNEQEESQARYNLVETLCLSDSELENLQKLIDLTILERINQSSGPKVTFHEKVKSRSFIDYLASFNCHADDDEELLSLKVNADCGPIGMKLFEKFLENGKSLAGFIDEVRRSRISSEDLMKLFLSYWLQKPFRYTKIEELIIDLIRFSSILQQICAIDPDSVSYDYSTISIWWQSVREMLLESTAALMSLLAAIMCRNHAARYYKRENSNDENSSSTEEEHWEQVSQEVAQWSLLIGKLDDIAALGAILGYSKPCQNIELPILPYQRPDVSLKAIVSGGKGIVSELVAKWIASSGVDPILLLEEVTNIDGSDINDKTSEECTAFLNYLDTLRCHFPFSTQSGIILCHLAWEYMRMWSNHLSDLTYLKTALRCLNTIKKSEYALKHGICCMIWNAHLKIPLEAARKLINKMGRLPKEVFCQQSIGMSDYLIAEFLDLSITFLKHFGSSIDGEKCDLRFEELLQDGQIPLSLLALQQNSANADLLDLHVQLCDVLFVISSLSIKYTKPVQNLFDAMSNESFFCEINRQLTYALPKSDLVLRRRRMEFLCLTITTTMDLIREDHNGAYLDDHKYWMKRIGDIANVWELNMDELRRHQILELYLHHWDEYAEELIDGVFDVQSMGVTLLKVAGYRLLAHTKLSPAAYAQVASVGTMVIDYLDSLEESNEYSFNRTINAESLEQLINLAGQVYKCLSDKDTRELRLAGHLFDACSVLKESM